MPLEELIVERFRALAAGDFRTLTLAASVFGLTLAMWLVLVLLWTRSRSDRQRQIQRRLKEIGSGPSSEARTLRLWLDKGQFETTTVLDERRRSWWSRFRRLPADAGWDTTPGVVLLQLLFFCSIPAAVMYVATDRIIPALLAGACVLLIFWWFVTVKISKRQQMFERQLIDALELCARALRAGHPLLSSFELISEEIPAPIGPIFGEICQLQAMGLSLEDAVRETTGRMESADLRLFAASLSINLRTGGNLAEVVDGIARVIRDRVRLGRRFRVLISQTQFSKRVLLALPVIMFFVLNFINPPYMRRLYDETTGNILLGIAGGGMLMGWWVMNRMSSLKH